MRGKVKFYIFGNDVTGITPAYAGKSCRFDWFSLETQDHPRLCGEKFVAPPRNPNSKGSPPPMRGKVLKFLKETSLTGITPAYAGKSELRHMLRNCIQDHPRLCGEKTGLQCSWEKKRGSPPPMRGKVYCPWHLLLETRITPAYAGKSLIFSPRRLPPEDHPRLCGEKKIKIHLT